MSLFRMLPIAAIALAAAVAPAQAAEVRKFDRATFEAAKAAGRPVLVDVKAWWCPVCASQNGTIKAAITNNPTYDKLLILEVNYDSQQAEWRPLGVRKQATLIGFKGTQEVGRIEFKTDKAMINNLLQTLVK